MKIGNSLASAGGLLRDGDGRWVKGYMVNIGATDSLMAELGGVREGLLLARSLEVQSLIVELDAMTVVQFLKQGVEESYPCYILIQDCRHVMEGGWVKEVKHIYRQGNRCADMLANLAQDYPPSVHTLEEAPQELLSLLSEDRQGVRILRS